MKRYGILTVIFLYGVTLLWNCSSQKIRPDMTQQERFSLAKRLFEEEKYLQAKLVLETMTNLNIISSVIVFTGKTILWQSVNTSGLSGNIRIRRW